MKRNLTFLFFALTSFYATVFGQRQDVILWSLTEQQTLACNIKSLLDAYHEDLIHRHIAPTIHTQNNFFVWHKFYIHKMEK